MASVEGFETTLKDVVHAKRLSASKVGKLTELATQLMEHDTQLVSILYRTHKSASGTSKINSLYAFDALARAARSHATKHKADVHAIVGNSATFLIKVEGVLEGLFQDILASGHPEAKEKTKKILDIWLKSNTFPSAVLTRLHKLVKEADQGKEKEPDKATAVTADPRMHTAPSTTTTTTPPQATAPAAAHEQPAEALQSTLLALLSQAANVAATSQTAPNTANAPSIVGLQTDPAQLALFQQLTRAANAGGSVATAGSNQRVPVPMSVVPPSANVPPVASPVGGPSQAYPYRDDRHGFARREPHSDRFNGPPRGRESYDTRDQRGGFSRGAPRGRGRGRWDDRQPDRNRGPDWRSPPPPGRNMQSRSRSPVGRQGRNVRPYSPPRKQPYYPSAPTPPRHLPPTNESVGEKDEFGRDIRPHSPHEDSPAPTPGAADLSPSRSVSIPTDEQGSAFPDTRQPGVASPSTSQTMPPSTAPFIAAGGGLDSFDLTSFDPTAPASWERLGKAWNTTHGYMPSQEELMQYVMSMNTANTFPIMSQYEETPVKQWSDNQHNGWSRGGQRRGGRGYRGSFGRGHEYGNSRGGFGGRGRQFEQDTDALTLVGGDESAQYTVPVHDGSNEQDAYYGSAAYENSAVDSSGNSGGHMEKVGDGWVWKEAAGVA